MHHTYIYIYITHKNILKPIFHLAIISLFNIALLSPTIPPAGNRSIGRHHPRLSPSSNLAIRKSSSPLASIAGICVREKWNPHTRSHAIGAKVLSKVQPWRGEEAGQTFDECRNSTKGGGGNYGWLNGSRNSVGRCFTRDT